MGQDGSRQGLEPIYKRGLSGGAMRNVLTERAVRVESPTAWRRLERWRCRAAQNRILNVKISDFSSEKSGVVLGVFDF